MDQEDDKECWEHPQEGTVKIKFGASIFETFNSYCLSMVAWNHEGALITASVSCSGRMAPELAEALSIREALSWIKNKSTSPVIVDTNWLTVIQVIRFSTTLSWIKKQEYVFDYSRDRLLNGDSSH